MVKFIYVEKKLKNPPVFMKSNPCEMSSRSVILSRKEGRPPDIMALN